MLLELHPTTVWLDRAARDPTERQPHRLPETLDFRPWAPLLRAYARGALPDTEIGCPIVAGELEIRFSTDLAWQARYPAQLAGGWFIGTFHVHPPGREPTFDPHDLAGLLRSDNAGFLDLLAAGSRLLALVRTNPFLYVAADRVNRDPWLFRETFEREIRRRSPPPTPDRPEYELACSRALRYYCERYQLALYQGSFDEPLRRTFTPRP